VKNEKIVSRVASLALLALLLALAGCSKNDRSAASSAAAQNDAALIAAGKTAFDTNGCARCHSIGGQGGHMGPDLTRVGAEAGHTPQWLVEHVKNPRAHSPSSRMPAFEGKISDRDLLALGAYLSSLK
jgi:mono/diheme cytochrome c family protein